MSSDAQQVLKVLGAGLITAILVDAIFGKNSGQQHPALPVEPQDALPKIAEISSSQAKKKKGESKKSVSFKQRAMPQKDVKIIRDLFKKEYYSKAVSHSCAALFDLIRKKSGIKNKDGMELMDHVFSPSGPILKINPYTTYQHINAHSGYYFLLKGIVGAFRNPVSHANLKMKKEEAELQINIILYLYATIKCHAVKTKK